MEKLAIEFEELFWDPEPDLMNIVQDDWTLIVNCYKHCTKKPILLMFNYGKQCDYYNSLSDEELVASAIKALKQIFPKTPDTCKSYLRTNWVTDKYSKMSYTH